MDSIPGVGNQAFYGPGFNLERFCIGGHKNNVRFRLPRIHLGNNPVTGC